MIDETIFQNVIDALPVNLFWESPDRIILGNNLRHAKSFGYDSPDELIGINSQLLLKDAGMKEKWRNFIHKNHTEVMETGTGKVVEYNLIELITGAEARSYRTYIEPLRNKERKIAGVIGIAIDISDLKQTQADLLKANVKAEASSKSKSEFIANMSHDIRTPITGIIGMVQELLNAANKTEAHLDKEEHALQTKEELIDTLNKVSSLVPLVKRDGQFLMSATDELLRLCNEILETVSLETGEVTEKPESFDIRELIRRNIDLLQPVARNRQLTLSVEVADNVPQYVSGLRAYFERVILNLTSNALKFTDIGFVKLILSLDSSPQSPLKTGDTVTLKFCVEDSGIGIPEDKFDIIFEHFSRLTPSFEGVYKGSGLGLYTVKQYLKAMDGNITLESELSKGTTFIVRVPLTVAESAEYQPGTIKVEKKQDTVSSPQKSVLSLDTPDDPAGHILVVEDSYPAAVGIRISLIKQFNCSVEIADTATKGIEKAAKGGYDLVLMDIGLPDMDGTEAAKQIRALPSPQGGVPIVALTGHMNKKQACLLAGMQDLLVKPAQPMILESVLQRYVFEQEPAQAAQESVEVTDLAADDALPLIDWDASIRMCASDEKIAQELLAVCVSELTVTHEQLAQLYEEGNIDALRAELHRCLGGVSYLALPRLEASLKAFQSAVKAEPQQPEILDQTYHRAKQTISDFLAAYEKNQFRS